jgi:esterase
MKLHHQIVGTGPPLLILHGLLGALDNWMPQAQRLAADFQVFLLDLRNHGRSPHAAEFNYEVMAADVFEFIRDHHLGPVNLLGHSLGGKVAMRFAQLHPSSVANLVVVDMAPREYPPRYDGVLAAMHALDLGAFHHRAEVDAALAAVAAEKSLRQFLLKNVGRTATGALRWKPNLAAILANYENIRRALPRHQIFAGRTLLVRGGKSDYLRAADFDLIRQIFPQAELQTIIGAGHWIHADAPEEFLRLVREFFWQKGE